MSGPAGLTARRAALRLVRRTLEERRALDEAALHGELSPSERARALSLARAICRWAGSADALIDQLSNRPPKPAVRDVLRLGVVELCTEELAPHGVVDSLVRLTKERAEIAGAAGFVNALLRRIAAEGGAIWAGLDHGRLATPPWLTRALRRDWGRAKAAAIGAAHLQGAPLDLTPRDGDAAALAARLGGAATPLGTVRLSDHGRLSGLAGYDDGAWWAQDAAAAAPARLAGPGGGRGALDLCAAPGGKTMQLAAQGWAVTALDRDGARLGRLRDNLARTKLTAEVVEAAAEEWEDARVFDLVLLDAPCSATGTIRRHPELPHIRAEDDDGAILARQAALLDAAWPRVAPGGALIYCVCALAKAEGEAQIASFLSRQPEAAPAPIQMAEIGDPSLLDADGNFRARPDLWSEIGGLDGFFAARVIRPS